MFNVQIYISKIRHLLSGVIFRFLPNRNLVIYIYKIPRGSYPDIYIIYTYMYIYIYIYIYIYQGIPPDFRGSWRSLKGYIFHGLSFFEILWKGGYPLGGLVSPGRDLVLSGP